MSLFLIDSNILIEAKNRHYGFDFCPAFWDFLDGEIDKTTIFTIKEVYAELSNANDDLAHWIKDRKDSSFVVTVDDENTQKEFAKIAQYVVSNFSQAEANKFLSVADPWLIAKAKVMEATIVTHEVYAQPNPKKVKIPNICVHFGVNYTNPFDMLRNLNAKFVI